MNFSHIEYGRTRYRGESSNSRSDSSGFSRGLRPGPQSGYRSQRSPSSASSSPMLDQHMDRRGRSRTISSSDDEPMFHLELTPPPSIAPEPPKFLPTCKLPIFISPQSMHLSAAQVLRQSYKLHSMGRCTTYAPVKGTEAEAKSQRQVIEVVEEFGAYHLGGRLGREQLPSTIAQINRTLRGATSLALMLLFAAGEVQNSDPKSIIMSKVEAFVTQVRAAQPQPQVVVPVPAPAPKPRAFDLHLR